MLKEIRCSLFREKVIHFHNGLNVVLGDNEGSNSIGKSTLLMIIDFVFGGESYIEHNKDVVSKLEHHEFEFIFEFNHIKMYFSRSTKEPKIVYECNENFEKLREVKLADYCVTLKENYGIRSEHMTFRSEVSLFSRVWGKHNLDVKRPMHNFPKESNSNTVKRLIMIFNKYNEIVAEDEQLKKLIDSRLTLNKAKKHEYISIITKKIYKRNEKEIETLKEEIDSLKISTFNTTIHLDDFVSEELLQLKQEKANLLKEFNYYKLRYNRVDVKIGASKNVEFENILQFFPSVNVGKIKEIERFHEDISSILNQELLKARRELKVKVDFMEEELKLINEKLVNILNPYEQPSLFLENILEQSAKLKGLQEENFNYDRMQQIKSDIAAKTITLNQIKEAILKIIMNRINGKLKSINDIVHASTRTSPELKLFENDYEYIGLDNTGTGKAYTNLMIFDLAILTLTDLPFIIHDSVLFKNIEKVAVENFINIYKAFEKQIFIAIDVINIYDENTQRTLKDSKVLELSTDKLLFTLDWRDTRV